MRGKSRKPARLMTAGGQKDKKTERKKKDNAEFGWQSLNEGSFIWMHIDSKPTDELSMKRCMTIHLITLIGKISSQENISLYHIS